MQEKIQLFRAHKLIHVDPRPFKCDLCPETYSWMSQIRQHILAKHCENFWVKCDKCEFKAKKFCTMNYHKKKLHDYKKFRCTICGREFLTSGNLRQHEVVHSTTKDYSCTVCGNQFASPHYLHSHVKKVHCKIFHQHYLEKNSFNSYLQLRRHSNATNATKSSNGNPDLTNI